MESVYHFCGINSVNSFEICLQELVKRGGLVSQCNKYGETPLDKCKPYLAEILRGREIF